MAEPLYDSDVPVSPKVDYKLENARQRLKMALGSREAADAVEELIEALLRRQA